MSSTHLPIHRPALRAFIALALVAVTASVWFGLYPLPEPSGQVAIAAPDASARGEPSIAASPSWTSESTQPSAASPSPRSSSTVRPVAGAGQAPVAIGSAGTLPPTAPTSPGLVPTGSSAEIPVAALANSATDATRRALTQRLGTLRATYGMPGVSAAILFPDGTMWRATSGFADVATKRRLTADTEFAVASISKTFLAALILVLDDEGGLDVETPATTYLPDLAIDPTITIRQLLDHTSGLHDYFYDPDIDRALLADRTRVWTAEEALSHVGMPYFEPGAGWHYSNTNYVVLGQVAEAVGGAPLAEQLRTRFLAPLGLDHTHYQGVEKPLGPVARAYRFSGPGLRLRPIPLSDRSNIVPFTSVVTAAGSAGSIASTADDLVIWARALYGGRVLSPASLTAMVADVAVTAPFKPSIPYGLGVQAATVDGRPTLGHSGRLLGSRTVVRWLPDQGMAIAVLTNQSRNDPNLVARALLRVVLGTPIECTGCPTVR
ncbi:MAG: serine hydrolase domain-containing protein [Chloroflexota bacterium]